MELSVERWISGTREVLDLDLGSYYILDVLDGSYSRDIVVDNRVDSIT